MSAIEALLHGFIDYAGLYPPAGLEMRAAVRNYLAYREGPHAPVLGRFIVDMLRMQEFKECAGDVLGSIPLSIIAQPDCPRGLFLDHLEAGFRIECVEIKCDEPLTLARIHEQFPVDVQTYFEISVQRSCTNAVDAIAAIGARAKLRMGGVVANAFPASEHVIETLHLLADRKLPFKATAGLHHPVRSRHRLTYAADALEGTMHGFLNLFWAAALLWLGESMDAAQQALEEQDAGAFRFEADRMTWRARCLSADQVLTIRQEFFMSFGSCSFTEPIDDLEALGWF